jgi:uncharacterized protein
MGWIQGMKDQTTTVIYHSADFDGIFCREIAHKFLPNAELIGWNFGDAPLQIPINRLYVLDLPIDRVFGFDYTKNGNERGPQHPSGLIWIDHHKSSIESHPKDIPGYRIDGVAACRLAWAWFKSMPEHAVPNFAGRGVEETLPSKQDFIDRKVSEPWAVCLAGEYDIWDKRDPDAELFQHGLRSRELTDEIWSFLLTPTPLRENITVLELLERGEALQYARTKENESIITHNGFTMHWEGLCFLACNAVRFNSLLFTAGLKSEHDACFGFNWNGKAWVISLYHAPGKEHIDLSKIAVRYGGGGHAGACGFQTDTLPFGKNNISHNQPV